MLVIGQLGKLLGLSIEARDPLRAAVGGACSELGDVSGATVARRRGLARGAARRCASSCRGFPRALVVVVGAIGVSWALDLAAHGVAVVGPIPAACRSSTLPTPAVRRRRSSWCRRRVGIFLVSFADEILTARSFAGKHNQHVRASQELLAMGAANAAAGFTQGFSIGASGSRTAVNDGDGRAHARSPG